MHTLEELWYGNICPSDQPVQKESEYAQALHLVVAARESLPASLPSELQSKIDTLLDAQMSAAVIAERDAFVMGFRLAVQLLLDCLKKPQSCF